MPELDGVFLNTDDTLFDRRWAVYAKQKVMFQIKGLFRSIAPSWLRRDCLSNSGAHVVFRIRGLAPLEQSLPCLTHAH